MIFKTLIKSNCIPTYFGSGHRHHHHVYTLKHRITKICLSGYVHAVRFTSLCL
jgi:hypothetical protein